jgi:hypothetical protein
MRWEFHTDSSAAAREGCIAAEEFDVSGAARGGGEQIDDADDKLI